MAFFDNRTSLLQLDSLLDLSFSHICNAIFDHHATTVFPFNIFLVVLADDGQNDSFFEDLDTNRKLPLLKDHAYFFPCGRKMKIDITEGVTLLSFHFNLLYLHSIDIFFESEPLQMKYDSDFVKKIYFWANEEKDELKAICALKSEVMRFCLPFWPEDRMQTLSVFKKYEPVFRFIHDNGNAELTVGDLAEQAQLRQDVFSRAFSRDLGRSPKKFIQEDLIRKISLRLLSPKKTVKEVSEDLKFSSEFYMSYFFKKHTGYSPRDFQNKFRKHK